MSDTTAPSSTIAVDADPAGDQDDVAVLPWWQSPLNLITLGIAVAVLAAGLGWLVGNNRALPDPNATDVGFLQDMRVHHEQAVQMSLIFLDTAGTDRALQTTAREIIVGQNIEVGRMIQLLRGFGKPEINDSDVAMGWMGTPVALDQMPGLASEAGIDALSAATGAEADEIFVELMTAHHQGGIHMAEHAATHAATSEVARMARQMAEVQREEIDEMARLLDASRG